MKALSGFYVDSKNFDILSAKQSLFTQKVQWYSYNLFCQTNCLISTLMISTLKMAIIQSYM